jgi:hypothetical protein
VITGNDIHGHEPTVIRNSLLPPTSKNTDAEFAVITGAGRTLIEESFKSIRLLSINPRETMPEGIFGGILQSAAFGFRYTQTELAEISPLTKSRVRLKSAVGNILLDKMVTFVTIGKGLTKTIG